MSSERNKYVTLIDNTDSIVSEQSNDITASKSVEISTQTELLDDTSEGGGSVVGAIFILMNAVLGAGILEFPYTFSRVGLITAFLMLAFLLLAAGVTHIVLAQAVDRTDATNYHQLIGSVCGNKILMLVQIALILYTLGSCIAYMVTIGDQLTDVCFYITNTTVKEHEFYCDRHFLIPVASFVAIFPIIWFKNISAFSYVSFFSVASIFYLVAAVVFEYLTTDTRTNINIWYPNDDTDPLKILGVLPVISFGYQCHMTSVPLYAELKHRSIHKYAVVVGVAMFLATTSYIIVGIVGFSMFGTAVNPDIILSFPRDSIPMTIGRVSVAMAICMTYPVVMFIGRGALEGAVIQLTSGCASPLRPGNTAFRLASIPIWFAVSLVVAVFATGLKDVISVVGSIAATFMFFFPGCMMCVTAWRRANYAHVLVGASFIVLGVFVFSWNIVDTIYEHVHGHHKTLVTWWQFQVPLA